MQEVSQNILWKRKDCLWLPWVDSEETKDSNDKWGKGLCTAMTFRAQIQLSDHFVEAWLYHILLCARSPSFLIPISLVCDTHLHSMGHKNMMKAFYTNVFPLPLPINGAGKGSSISGPFPWVLIPTEILKLNLSLHNGLNYKESTTAYIINEKSPAQAADRSAKSCRFNSQWVEPEPKKQSIFPL